MEELICRGFILHRLSDKLPLIIATIISILFFSIAHFSKMFEEGGRLKAIYGADDVYDYSIGNPDLEPPKEVFDALKDLANNPTPGMHGYMPNAGYPSTRTIVAEKRGKEAGMEI